jgi:hypothetical protein
VPAERQVLTVRFARNVAVLRSPAASGDPQALALLEQLSSKKTLLSMLLPQAFNAPPTSGCSGPRAFSAMAMLRR